MHDTLYRVKCGVVYRWYAKAVNTLASLGIIKGCGNGRFAPNRTITRAEVAVIVNNMLGRDADEEYVLSHMDELTRFPDINDSARWYFFDVVEASTTHSFTALDGAELWNR